MVLKTGSNEFFHSRRMFFHTLQQLELGFGTYQIMFRILDFIIGISIYVISQETYTLHVREQSGCIGMTWPTPDIL